MKHHLQSDRSKGFTIVELLIVIVVIGILAGITIVAYTGIQQRAREASATAATRQVSDKLAVYYAQNNTYPALLSDIGINDGTTSYQYTVDNGTIPPTYCVTATVSTSSAKSSSTAQPSSGACPGHNNGGVPNITNLATNPALLSNATTYTGVNTTGQTRVAIGDLPGFSYAYQALGSVDGSRIVVGPAVGNVVIGQLYTARVWAKMTAGTSMGLQVSNSAGTVYGSVKLYGTATGNWQLLSIDFTPTETNWRLAVRQTSAGTTTIMMTGIMVTAGATAYEYADGNSPNWAWTGTANASASTGPAL